MEKTGTSQHGFFRLCVVIALLLFFAGVLVALFAKPNPQTLVEKRVRNVRAQLHRAKTRPVVPPAGVYEAWVARYNGPGNDVDVPETMDVDDAGNVYVSGYSAGADGLLDYATVKYDSTGLQQWVARYNGPANDYDIATAVAVDDSGNVYVTGESVGPGSSFDYATIKYDSAGNQQWVARYNGPGNAVDEGTAIAVDGAGNVYVTGNSVGSGTGPDYATIKYNADGQQQWVARYNGPGNAEDVPVALELDSSGNVYVTGHSFGSGSGYDYATVKYDSAGQQKWVARYNGPGNGGDEAADLAVDNSGNVYVTGGSTGSTTGIDIVTIKYNSAGQEQWVATYNGPGNSVDYAEAIALDDLNNVYVAGASTSEQGSYNFATVKYNASGQQMWVAGYGGTGAGDNQADEIDVDKSGNVYVTGESFGFGTGNDYATVKYNSIGQEQWVVRYDGPTNGDDFASGLAVDSSNNVYVTGRSMGPGGAFDYATAKYVQTGSPTPTPTPTCPPGQLIENGGFETGDFTGWVIDGTNNPPLVVNTLSHSGTFSALIGGDGTPQGHCPSGAEPTGDSSFYQQFTVPVNGGTLTFWHWDCFPDDIDFDYQDAYITDSNGNILQTIFHLQDQSRTWLKEAVDMAPYAGQTVRIKFLVHQDGFGDITDMFVDDVQLSVPCPSPTPTATATATFTATPTPTPRATPTPRNQPTPRLRPTPGPRP